jgi:hypothetical protein
MDEVIIDIDKELAILRGPKKGQGRLAPVQSFCGYSASRHNKPCFDKSLILDIIFVANGASFLTLCREYV